MLTAVITVAVAAVFLWATMGAMTSRRFSYKETVMPPTQTPGPTATPTPPAGTDENDPRTCG